MGSKQSTCNHLKKVKCKEKDPKKNRTRVKAVSAQYLVVAAQGIYLSDSERLGPDEPR